MKPISLLTLFFCCSLAVLSLTGCGGHSATSLPITSGATQGSARFTILWPERRAPGRLIPLMANSIKVQLRDSTNTLRATQIVVRPAEGNTSTVNFPSLPTGTLGVVASAYPESNGTGVSLARGAGELVVRLNENTTLSLTMQSTITEVELVATPNPLKIGQIATLSLRARDSAGSLVLTSPTRWKFTSLKPNIARILPSGYELEGRNAGTTFVTATDEESGRSAQAALTVTPDIEYKVVPLFKPDTAAGMDVMAVNNQGWVTGNLRSGTSRYPFLWKLRPDQSGGDFAPIDPYPGMPETFMDAINNAGVILGHATNATTTVFFLWENGTYTTLPSDFRGALDLSDTKQVVGYGTEGSVNYSLLAQGNTLTRLPLFGQNSAQGINAAGTVVGRSLLDLYNRGYRYQNSAISLLLPPAGFTSFQAEKINSKGSVLGTCYGSASGKTSMGIATGDTVVALPTPEGMSYADGTNIADDDLVVGYAVASGSVEFGLRWRNGIVQNLNNLVPVGTTLIIAAEDVSDNGLILCTNESTYSDCLLIPL